MSDDFDAACAAYNVERAKFITACLVEVIRITRQHYPEADTLSVTGRYEEELDITPISVTTTRDNETVLLGSEIAEGFIDEDFEAFSQDVEVPLSWLATLTGDDYLGEIGIGLLLQ